jgi:hypothetical protein
MSNTPSSQIIACTNMYAAAKQRIDQAWLYDTILAASIWNWDKKIQVGNRPLQAVMIYAHTRKRTTTRAVSGHALATGTRRETQASPPPPSSIREQQLSVDS